MIAKNYYLPPLFMNKKLIKKTIIYRISALLIGLIITYVMLTEIELSIRLVVIESVIMTMWYFIYESLWEK